MPTPSGRPTADEKRASERAKLWAESQRLAVELAPDLDPLADAIQAGAEAPNYAGHEVPSERHARALVAILDARGIRASRTTSFSLASLDRTTRYYVRANR